MSKRSSPIWDFFTIINSTTQIAKCDMCKANISFKSSVSNLKRHIIKKHPTVKIGEVETRSSSSSISATNDPGSRSNQNQHLDLEVHINIYF